jgi:membrane protein
MTTQGERKPAEQPRERRKGVGRLIGRTLQKAWDGNFFSESAEAGFWQALSLAPLMLGLLGLLGYVEDWFGRDVADRVGQQILTICENIFSDEVVRNIVQPTVEDMLTEGKAAIASVGFLIALWAGSSAMSSFVDAITVAHDQYGVRNSVWQRIFALLLYVASLILLVIGLPLIAIGPELLPELFPTDIRDNIATWVSILYYPTLGVLIVLALATLYKVALPRKLPWHRGLPGAVLAMIIFLLASSGLRFYLEIITATGYTYGALATFVAFLLFLFFIGMGIVVGAYFNSAIQELWPAKPTRRQRRRWRKLELERANEKLKADNARSLWERTTAPLRRPNRPPEQDTNQAQAPRPQAEGRTAQPPTSDQAAQPRTRNPATPPQPPSQDTQPQERNQPEQTPHGERPPVGEATTDDPGSAPRDGRGLPGDSPGHGRHQSLSSPPGGKLS